MKSWNSLEIKKDIVDVDTNKTKKSIEVKFLSGKYGGYKLIHPKKHYRDLEDTISLAYDDNWEFMFFKGSDEIYAEEKDVKKEFNKWVVIGDSIDVSEIKIVDSLFERYNIPIKKENMDEKNYFVYMDNDKYKQLLEKDKKELDIEIQKIYVH